MDPNACVDRICRIYRAKPMEVDDLEDAVWDLLGWLSKGGFAPSNIKNITEEMLLFLHLQLGGVSLDPIRRAQEGK
jgi:hypothetical protein